MRHPVNLSPHSVIEVCAGLRRRPLLALAAVFTVRLALSLDTAALE